MSARTLNLHGFPRGLLPAPRTLAVAEPRPSPEGPSRNARLEIAPDLVRRCREGDPDAFDELFERSKDHVYTLALYFSGDEDAAADVTQEVFLKLLDRIGQFREHAELSTWLYRVVLNAFLDQRRGRRPWLPLEASDDGSEAPRELTLEPPQERSAVDGQTAAVVRRAVAGLKPKWRAPVVLRYGAGLSYEEIAAVLGISPGTVASRLHRAHDRLARQLRHLRPGAGQYLFSAAGSGRA